MKKDVLASLKKFRVGNWMIKLSVLDDQILVVLFNIETLTMYCEMFYNDDLAHNFIERVLSDDQDY